MILKVTHNNYLIQFVMPRTLTCRGTRHDVRVVGMHRLHLLCVHVVGAPARDALENVATARQIFQSRNSQNNHFRFPLYSPVLVCPLSILDLGLDGRVSLSQNVFLVRLIRTHRDEDAAAIPANAMTRTLERIRPINLPIIHMNSAGLDDRVCNGGVRKAGRAQVLDHDGAGRFVHCVQIPCK